MMAIRSRSNRLRWLMVLCFILLAIPILVLTLKARQQIKWEALYQNRQLAEELTQRIDSQLQTLIAREQNRSPEEYNFLITNSNSVQNYQRRSPLSDLSIPDAAPGLIGYFQVNSKGEFQSPLIPKQEASALKWGVDGDELTKRQQLSQRLLSILNDNALLEAETPAPTFAQADDDGSNRNVQKNFDALAESTSNLYSQRKALGKIAELKLERRFADTEMADEIVEKEEYVEAVAAEPSRKQKTTPAAIMPKPPTIELQPVTLFENADAPFDLALLNSGHFVLYRKIWQNNQGLVQGLVLQQDSFLDALIQAPFNNSVLATLSSLVMAYQGDVFRIFSNTNSRYDLNFNSLSAQDVSGTLLLQQNLTSPFNKLELIYSANKLPMGPGGQVITWVSVVLMMLLLMVFSALYRLGIKQIRLHEQQQNFISSVSHELKTPLTSIRMFSEILKEGWVTPEKQMEYYQYISDESERLSRLIGNVLQLARMERQALQLDIKTTPINTVLDLVRSRLQSQVERSEFTLKIEMPEAPDLCIDIDSDALMQILLNLVDNSIKFSAQAAKKQIDLSVTISNHEIEFKLRDYGPGIAPNQLKKIFQLFYRIGNELTRSAQGTGIGLALVQQLALAMNGKISVENHAPGVEFTVVFPTA